MEGCCECNTPANGINKVGLINFKTTLMKNNILIFTKDKFKVRNVNIDNEIWFVAIDSIKNRVDIEDKNTVVIRDAW